MKPCGKLNGYCVHQDKDSCDGCELMETWLKYKDKSIKLFKEHLEQLRRSGMECKTDCPCNSNGKCTWTTYYDTCEGKTKKNV